MEHPVYGGRDLPPETTGSCATGTDGHHAAATLVNPFLATVNLVFPVIDAQNSLLLGQAHANHAPGSESQTIEMVRLLVLAAGASPNDTKRNGNLRILNFAFSRLSDLIQDESIDSITALVLMAILSGTATRTSV
jgi:hypothetical protein